jgi:uncharacterized protein
MRLASFQHLRAMVGKSARCALFLIVMTAALLIRAAAETSSERPANGPAEGRQHHVVILIDSDDEKVMGHAISYSMNIARAYASRNEKVKIEIVANGLGIKLFRADISPLQQPLVALRQVIPDIVFSMCDASRQIAEQKEGHPIGLIAGARLVPFGIGRLVELQEAGWSYVHG